MALAWAANVPILHAVLADTDRGLDAMDESHYLMAAQPWAADKAFNGVFGWYSGPMLRLVGEDLGRLRLLAALILIGAALVLARAVRRVSQGAAGRPWSPGLRALCPPAVVAAALCYYTVFVRTPSYNWFAAVGLMLLAAGLLEVLVLDRPGPAAVVAGALVALGAFITAVGKATTAVASVAVVLAVVAGHVVYTLVRRRSAARALGVAAASTLGTALLVALLHVSLVHSLPFTVATYQRVAGILSAVDPGRYAPGMLTSIARAGLRNILVDRPQPFLSLLLLPLLAGVAGAVWTARRGVRARGVPAPGWWPALAHGVVWWVTLLVVLWHYPGGVPGLGMSIPPLVVAAEASVVVAVSGWLAAVVGSDDARDGEAATASDRRPGMAATACLALLVVGVVYPVGTNVEYATQLHGGFPVLLAAAVVGVSALPDGAAEAAVLSLVAGALLLGAVLVPMTRAVAPYRIALLGQQTVPRAVVAGTPEILVDASTATWIDDLRRLGITGGFAPGTPMLDLTWHPASVLILGGRAPSVLLPAFPGWTDPAGSAAYALRQEDATVWNRAWLLVPHGQDDALTDGATVVVGRHFPADYELVGTVTAPYDGQPQGLWRPRP
ncbi:MAG: hypothetical protein IPJ14_18235 [Kineosporiaceae bacterium]|nr:hypothetical protein [Kineosporiaceae bacterium]